MQLSVAVARAFWPMPTITPWWRGRPTMLGNTARGASSPAKPACVCRGRVSVRRCEVCPGRSLGHVPRSTAPSVNGSLWRAANVVPSAGQPHETSRSAGARCSSLRKEKGTV